MVVDSAVSVQQSAVSFLFFRLNAECLPSDGNNEKGAVRLRNALTRPTRLHGDEFGRLDVGHLFSQNTQTALTSRCTPSHNGCIRSYRSRMPASFVAGRRDVTSSAAPFGGATGSAFVG